MADTDPAAGPDTGPDQFVVLVETEPIDGASGPVTLTGDVLLLPGLTGWYVFGSSIDEGTFS